MRLDDAVPAADVAPFVMAFHDLDANTLSVGHADAARIRFHLSGQPLAYRLPDAAARPVSGIHLLGAAAGGLDVSADEATVVFDIVLTPDGWAAAIGGDGSLMAHRVIDATIVFGMGIRPALAALRAAPDFAARAAVGEAVMRALVRTGDGGARGFVRQVDAWLSASPSPEMDALAAAAGLSRRQVERKCNALYGVPPKVLARKYRALRAAAAIRAGDEPLGAVIERGFYDQSHMIREIKQFTGLTPGQIKADPRPRAAPGGEPQS